jgi:hypothetical protein
MPGFFPLKQEIVFTKPFATLEINRSSLMQTHHTIDSQLQQ